MVITRLLLLSVSASVLAALCVIVPVSAATTSGWYFTVTGTTEPPTSTVSAIPPVASATSSSQSSSSYYWAPSNYALSLTRAPGLAPDLTSYFWQGMYITPDMVFQPTLAVAPTTYVGSMLTPLTFVPRNGTSRITFNNLPSSGTAHPVAQVLPVEFSYVNPTLNTQSLIVRDDVFDPNGQIVSSSTLARIFNPNDYAPLQLPLYFGGVTTSEGIYGVRVRMYDVGQDKIVDENSFNFRLQR